MMKKSALFLSILLAAAFMLYLPAVGRQFAAKGITVCTDRAAATEDARININTATAEELELLPGIGPALSAAIIERRESAGMFRQAEDLLDVTGIGEKKLAAIREMIRCDETR